MKIPTLLVLGAVAASGCLAGRAQTVALPAVAAVPAPPYLAQVFDTSKLHRIEVTIPPAGLANFKSRTAPRVGSTVSFDGTILRNVGVRQQGGSFLPYVGIGEKPSLSIKFNEFVKGQDLFGLNKLVLKNQRQDQSLVNEHLTYEVFRRGGMPAPLTAYAQVKINGVDQGIYLLREPVTQQFLVRNFGPGMGKGNLYEITFGHDPAVSPETSDLKDEVEEKRSRDDMRALAAAVAKATPATFARDLAPHLDLDRFISFFALETATSASDGYTFYVNNSYAYAHPRDGRFVFIPHGADMAFWAASRRVEVPRQQPRGALARGIMNSPELRAKYQAELARVGSAAVWNTPALLARVEEAARVLATAETSAAAKADLAKFKSRRPLIEAFIKAGGTTRGTGNLPR